MKRTKWYRIKRWFYMYEDWFLIPVLMLIGLSPVIVAVTYIILKGE